MNIHELLRDVEALRARIETLEGHQHSYYAAPGLTGQWCVTMPQRGADDSGHEAHMLAARAKKMFA